MTPAIDQLSAALAAGEDCRFALHDAYMEAGYPMQAEAVMAPRQLTWRQGMSREQAQDLVAMTVRNLGRLRFTDVLDEFLQHSTLATLFKKDRVILSDLPRPYMHAQGRYVISDREFALNGMRGIVDAIQVRRLATLVDMFAVLEEQFRDRAGSDANPEEWRAVVLKGQWMHETSYPMLTDRSTLVLIDCMVDFERHKSLVTYPRDLNALPR